MRSSRRQGGELLAIDATSEVDESQVRGQIAAALLHCAEGVARSRGRHKNAALKWAAVENRTPGSLLGGGQLVLVEFQEVVGGRQQPPLGQHG
jgi:hypothetical protein